MFLYFGSRFLKAVQTVKPPHPIVTLLGTVKSAR